MSKLQLSPLALVITSALVGIFILLIETFMTGSGNGTLLLTLSFWIALVQGTVAVVAAAEVAQGKWIGPMKRELLAFYPLILFFAIVFLVMSLHMDIYRWSENPGRWLNENFFIVRNFCLLLLSFFLAWLFANASLKESKNKGVLAILYIFSFVITQSFVAFDWIMSLDFPWISTMFGPIFFMESFYSGLALAGIIAAYLIIKKDENSEAITKVMRDVAIFMFGFALAWAGLYYGQFLVIWYGNIPWETSYFGMRMDHSPFKEMLYLTIFLLFIIPFVALLPRKVKVSTGWVGFISFLILIGIFIERIFYILPVVPVNIFATLIELILFGFLFILFFTNRRQILKSSAQ